MKRTLYILVVVLALLPCIAGAQVKPRVAGLGSNIEYMQLIEHEQELSRRADSLGGVLTRLREEFRNDPGEGRTFADRIAELEIKTFEVRNEASAAGARLRRIEEAFMLENPNAAVGAQIGTDDAHEQSADLVRNDIFRRSLPTEDHAALLRAQTVERHAADLLRRYFENYDRLAILAGEYATADSVTVADSLFATYLAIDRANAAIADSLGSQWNTIFDNKLFAYNYLLQTRNRADMLSRMEDAGRSVRDEIARQRDGAASEEVTAYFEQKGLVFEYETALAEMLGLGAAVDSLNHAAETFKRLKRPLPAVEIEERLFVEYSDIAVHNPAKYNAANPIPEVEVYRRGLIYRILLSTYKVRQVVSIFKGLAPLASAEKDGQWRYYAGGFADFRQAESALEDMKKRGFRNARIVVWNNGEALVLDEKPADGVSWRVEIEGTHISDEVREAISTADGGADISRSGDTFIVGPLQTAFEAEKVADAARKADPAISVRTVSY